MTKNQIIAKAMLSGLGIYAVVGFSTALVYNLYQVKGNWEVFTNVFLLVATLLLVSRFMIFKNDGFACKIAGPARETGQFDQRAYLIKTFRIAFVIIALSLLSSSKTWTTVAGLMQTLSLPHIRLWIKNAIYNRYINFSWAFAAGLWEAIKLLIIAYLLCGGSKLIGWHLKNSNLNNTNEELTNE
jgi:hypothetical protein